MFLSPNLICPDSRSRDDGLTRYMFFKGQTQSGQVFKVVCAEGKFKGSIKFKLLVMRSTLSSIHQSDELDTHLKELL